MKRIAALIALICLSLSLAACGKGAGEAAALPQGGAEPQREISAPVSTPVPTEDTSAVTTVEAVFTEEAHILPEGAAVKSAINLGGSLALLWTEEDREKLGLVPFTIDDKGEPSLGSLQEIAFEQPFEDCLAYALSTPGDGSFYLLCGDSRQGAALNLAVLGFDSAGSLTGLMEIPDWPLQTVDSFCAGPNGLLLAATGQEALVYTWGQGLTARLELDMPVSHTALTSKGIVLSGFSMDIRMFKYELLDLQSLQAGPLDVYSMGPSQDFDTVWTCLSHGSGGPCQSLDGRLLVNQDGYICAVDLEQGTKAMVLGWNEGTDPSSVYGPSCQIGDDSFACVLDGRLMLAWQGMAEKRESGVVRVGLVSPASNRSLMKYLTPINGGDTPYTLEIQEFFYIDYNDEGSMDRFNAQLASNAFDLIVFCQNYPLGTSQLEDLFPYLDADPELDRQAFLPGLMEGLTVKGQLKQLCTSVGISTLAAKESLVGDGTGLTVAGCQQILGENDALGSILDNKYSDQGSLRNDALLNLAWSAACAFVDKNAASCSFDSQEFKDLLELCGTLKADPDSSGNDFLLNVVQASNAGSLGYLEERLGPCSYVGYPDGGMGIHYYSTNDDDSLAVAIPTGSGNKAAAWGVIKYLLSPQRQWDVAGERGKMPVLLSVAEGYNRQNFSQEKVEEFFDLIERTRYVQTGADATIREMIIEICQPYLAGDKSLDETVKLLQSRVSIYMAEQYG